MKVCEKCLKEFSAQSNLSRHLRQIHGEPPKHSHSLICPLCDDSLTREKYFLAHLRHNHDLTIDERQLYFNTEDEFYKWKILMEKSTASYYRKDRSKKDSKQKTMYFTCNRSGSYSPKQERKRRLRAQGSRKINRTCPAKLIVTKNNASGQLSVYFIPTHVGHETDLKHLNLHKEDRLKIAKKLEMGVDRNQLLSKIRESLSSTSPQRLHMITVKDLRNIKDKCTKTREEIQAESQQERHLLLTPAMVTTGEMESSNVEVVTADNVTDFDVQIDGEIQMEEDGSILFEQNGNEQPEDRARLVENIMKNLDNEIPIETLNNIKELIETAKQKSKCVVDMGVPITRCGRRMVPTQAKSKTAMTIVPSTSPASRLRKILPKPSLDQTDSSKVNSSHPIETNLNETSNEATLASTILNHEANNHNNENPSSLQLIDVPADSQIRRINQSCFIIIPATK
ncbi:uncharacterized protein LOC107361757 [Tetranychus urticae]|uniref:C2H2-type domain-containing protein n=1 Tax=Tetranychus urticae TaxID=32264 RepID=T1JS78_TETUR|nr:uncharacterized protein LOC107361757 [Tetranychus urticae]